MGSEPVSIASTLPFDIWYHISSFLLDSQLRQLYSVNRAFYHITLSLRYRDVSIFRKPGVVGDINAAKYARILENPSLGKYVRALEIDPNISLPVPKRSFRVRALSVLVDRLHALLPPSRRSKADGVDDKIQQMKAFVSSLHRLTTLTVQWYWGFPPQPGPDIYTSIFLLGWSTFGQTLRTLSLHLTTESFLYLSHGDLHLPQLATLTIELFILPNPTDGTAVPQSSPRPFLNFIHRHSKTLKSLRIISLRPIDRQFLYFGIGHLPILEVLKLEEDKQHQDSSMSALCHFLSLNSATLTEFRWAPKLSPEWANVPTHPTRTQTPLDIHLPQLKKLSLNFKIYRRRSYDLGHILGYIGRHARTLTFLSLTGDRLTESEFQALIDTITTLQLRTLEVTLHHITLSTFPTVATHLRNLDTFLLEYDRFSPEVVGFYDISNSNDQPSRVTVSDQFIRGAQLPSLRSWRLGTLFVKRRGFWHHYHRRRDGAIPGDYVVVRTVLENIPSVQYINGMDRQDFLNLGVKVE